MVAAEQGYGGRTSDFETKDKHHGFYGEYTAIDEIAEKKVLCGVRVAADAEKFEQVVKLAVDVADDDDRVGDGNEIRLRLENVGGKFEDFDNILLEKPAIAFEVIADGFPVREVC